MAIRYLETSSTDPRYNLAFEEYVLENKSEGDWLILWQSANTVVIGLNQNAHEEINPEFIEEKGVTVVRRMTGGGAVYQDLGNLNYSFIEDAGNTEELSIERFSRPVCKALHSMGVEAQTSGRNDITVDGKKISGVAQRIFRKRILHHGTLLYSSDANMISGSLRADPTKFESKSAKSVRSRVGFIKDYVSDEMTLEQFKIRLLNELTAEGMLRVELNERELAEVERIAREKYGSWDWTYRKSPDYSYKNKRRFEGGSLEVCVDVREGEIADISVWGDFMARRESDDMVSALRGVRFEKDAVLARLKSIDLSEMFGAINAEEIAQTMFE